jgi:hypothetical protein
MKLRDEHYQQLVNHRGVIKMVAEQKLNVSNSPHDTMARVWMQLGQAPVNTNCNACVLATLCRHKQFNDTIREWHRLKQRQQRRISVCVKRAGRRSQRTNIVARQNKQGDKDENS